jgi:hypothetical protein
MATERDRLNDLESDIKATGEDLVEDALEVVRIEKAKVALPPDDPARTALANEAEVVAARMAQKTKIEKQLVDEARRAE